MVDVRALSCHSSERGYSGRERRTAVDSRNRGLGRMQRWCKGRRSRFVRLVVSVAVVAVASGGGGGESG